MLPLEHSAVLLTCIKQYLVLETNFLSFFRVAILHRFYCLNLLYLGLNEMYVWFLLPTYPSFFNPTLNIKMVFGEKIPKMGTFSDFVIIFFVKCYNKI